MNPKARKPFIRLPLAAALASSILGADIAMAQIEEIVVTAQRRAESVQDVPVSMTAFDADSLKAVNVARTSDLSAQTPNLQAVDGNFGLAAPILSLRGVSNTDFTAISNTPVSVYSDGMLLNNVQTHGFAMFDLDRVEILRGPQGTLFGRNSTTGAMQVISAQPTEEFESGFDVTIGENSRERIEAFVSGPIIQDKVYGRLSVASNRSDGFVEDQFGNDVQQEDVQAARSIVDFQLSDDLDMQVKLQYQKIDNTPIVFHNTLPVNQLDVPNFAAGGKASDFDTVTLNQDYKRKEKAETLGGSVKFEYDINDQFSLTSITSYLDHDMQYQNDEDASASRISHSQAFTDQKQFTQEFRLHADLGRWDVVGGLFYLSESVDSEVAYDLNALTETAMGGLSNPDVYAAIAAIDPMLVAGTTPVNDPVEGRPSLTLADIDNVLGNLGYTPGIPNFSIPGVTTHGEVFVGTGKSFSQQVIEANPGLNLNANSHMTMAQGVRALQAQGLIPAGDPSIYNSAKFDQSLESVALFTHAKFEIDEQWSATLGLRYTRDSKDIQTRARRCTLIQDPQNPANFSRNAALVDPSGAPAAQNALTFGVPLVLGNDLCPVQGDFYQKDKASWDAFTGKVGFEFQATEDILTYFNISKGFKGGGFDGQNGARIQEVDPEKLVSYELGVKTSWLDNRIVANAAYFYYDYTDFQAILAAQLPGTLFPDNVTFNVPKSRIEGAEIEVVSELIDNLHVSLGASWVESRVRKAPSIDFDQNAPDIQGNEFRYAPHFTFNGAVAYDIYIGDFGYITPQVDWVYTDEYYTDVVNREAGKVDDVWKTNLRLSWTSPTQQYYATAFVENLEDKVIITSNSTAFIATAGTSYSTVSAPRTVGLTFGARF